MKKLLIRRFVFYLLLISITLLSVYSCINKGKESSNLLFKENSKDIKSSINFKSVAYLNESNKKVIDLANIAFNQSKDIKKLQLLLKIKKDHQKVNSELRKLTEKNLIIIPRPIYNLNLNQDFMNDKNSNYYILNLLEVEIKNQIKLLKNIEQTSQNRGFINFAKKFSEIISANNQKLNDILNL